MAINNFGCCLQMDLSLALYLLYCFPTPMLLSSHKHSWPEALSVIHIIGVLEPVMTFMFSGLCKSGLDASATWLALLGFFFFFNLFLNAKTHCCAWIKNEHLCLHKMSFLRKKYVACSIAYLAMESLGSPWPVLDNISHTIKKSVFWIHFIIKQKLTKTATTKYIYIYIYIKEMLGG